MRAAAFALALLVPCVARAQPHPSASASDAQVHFERGLSLADDGNYAAAMVEFRYAYGNSHNPLLLYNIALAHQALGHYVEALDAMRSYEAGAGAQLPATRRAAVDAAIQRLQTRIGTLVVPIDIRGLDVRVDGIAYDAARAHAGIPLSVGTHLLSIRASGYETREQPIDVVSGVTARVDQPLIPVTTGFTVDSNVTGATVRVDGRDIGRTPLASVVGVPAGRHHLQVERNGYAPFDTYLDVSGPGARVNAPLAWLDPMPRELASHLRVEVHPDNVRASIDGRPIAFDGRDALPPGTHHLLLERQDFATVDHDVQLDPGSTARAEAWLQPTSSYAERLERRRALSGTLALVGGAMLVGGATGLIIAAVRAPATTNPDGWIAVSLLVSAPVGLTGLFMGTITSIRYLTQATPARYRPPHGHERFRVGVGLGSLELRWY